MDTRLSLGPPDGRSFDLRLHGNPDERARMTVFSTISEAVGQSPWIAVGAFHRSESTSREHQVCAGQRDCGATGTAARTAQAIRLVHHARRSKHYARIVGPRSADGGPSGCHTISSAWRRGLHRPGPASSLTCRASTAAKLSPAVDEVLSNSEYRHNAEKLKQDYPLKTMDWRERLICWRRHFPSFRQRRCA